MSMPKSVKYKNVTYYLQSNGRYYIGDISKKNGKRIKKLLHRKIWEDNFGTIPEGYDIHHKDEDWTNNEISNLELMESSEHQSMHMKDRWQDQEYRAATIKQLDIARDKASEWHKSIEGKEWHSINARQVWANKQTILKTCKRCNQTFQSYFETRGDFCSSSCSHYAFMQNSVKVTQLCPNCGISFEHSKHQARTFCNKSCAGKYNNAKRKIK